MKRRKLVLVDFENLIGQPPSVACTALYRSAYRALLEAVDVAEDDLVVIGVNPHLALTAARIAPGVRIVTRPGRDGAESRLVEEVEDVAFVQRRFGEVVVASGDHQFLEALIALNHHNVITTVASLPRQLAAATRLAAQHVVWLHMPCVESEAA